MTGPLDYHSAGIATAGVLAAIHQRGAKFDVLLGTSDDKRAVRLDITFKTPLLATERDALFRAIVTSPKPLEVCWTEPNGTRGQISAPGVAVEIER